MEQLSIDALRSFSGVGPVDLWTSSTALVFIDVQNRLVQPEGFTVGVLRARGLDEAAEQYLEQLTVAIPNMVSLLDRARATGQPVFHIRFKHLPGSQGGGTTRPLQLGEEASNFEIIDELAPNPDEFVLDKASSGAFPSTNIDYLLRRLGVTGLLFAGVVTDGCVEQAVRQAHDLGYSCVLASDACAALTNEIHQNALDRLYHRRSHIAETAKLLNSDHISATTVAIPALA